MKQSVKTICLTMALLVSVLFWTGATPAQSGRGLMHGYIAFDGVSYNDLAKGDVHAKIELRSITEGDQRVYTAQTNEHGAFDLRSIPMGDYILRISSPGYKTYEIEIYMPSDFSWNLAIKLKNANR
jgi:hypothetical protein